jgi:hypothetical protein
MSEKITITLRAFDRHSNKSLNETVRVKTIDEYLQESRRFNAEITFSRYYRDDEITYLPDGEDAKEWEAAIDEPEAYQD